MRSISIDAENSRLAHSSLDRSLGFSSEGGANLAVSDPVLVLPVSFTGVVGGLRRARPVVVAALLIIPFENHLGSGPVRIAYTQSVFARRPR